MAQEICCVALQTLYVPYFPVVAFAAIPEQAVGSEPHIWLKSVGAALVALTPDATTHDRDDNMQSQRAELGDGGKISDASHVEPVVGHDRATVLVGV